MFKLNCNFRIVCVFVLALVTISKAQYSRGSGTAEDPYQITTPEDWQILVDTMGDWDKHFVLINDLDMHGVDISPIGTIWNKFIGVFDGNDCIIYNVVIEQLGENVGLFGYLGPNGQIQNLGIEDANITGTHCVGGLVGCNDGGIITACSASGVVTGIGNKVGGLVGVNSNNGIIVACFATGSVVGNELVGGLAGSNSRSIINDCNAINSIKVSSDYGRWAGGLVGRNDQGSIYACSATGPVRGNERVGGLAGGNNVGTIKACSATGSVSGSAKVGGLVGYNHVGIVTVSSANYIVSEESHIVNGLVDVGGLVGNSHLGEITNCYTDLRPVHGNKTVGGLVGTNTGILSACYSKGYIEAKQYFGGLVGSNSGTVNDCFWDINTSGQGTSAGGTGITQSEMQTISTFTDAGWDFLNEEVNGVEETWTIPEDMNSPRLCWEVYYKIAYAPQPSDGSIHPDTWVELSWISSMTAGRHEVYFGETFEDVNDGLDEVFWGSRTEPNFTVGLPECPYPDGLVPNKPYYWRIDEVNEADPCSPWKGQVWNFTVVQKKASSPNPLNGAIDVGSYIILSWEPATDAESYMVYFGTDANAVAYATENSLEYKGLKSLGEESYDPGKLESAMTYYWRIDEYNSNEIQKGNVWSFTVLDSRKTWEGQVSTSEDDGYASNNNLQNIDGAFLKVGDSSFSQPPYYASGIIFRNVEIPQGAEIISAHLKIRSYNSQLSDIIFSTIQAEASDNATGFSTFRNIGTLSKTDACVNWDLSESWSADTWYTSPDIASVIQEVIDRSGWSESNAMAILYSARKNEGGFRQFSSYDRGNNYAPILEIRYEP